MLIAGALSGIQEYLFDIAQEGGRQARQLRARSFFIQLVAECAALRVRRALGWGHDALLYCGAGRFLLDGPDASPETVEAERVAIERWLLAETGGTLRFSLAGQSAGASAAVQYEELMLRLQREKARPWASLGRASGGWAPENLVLPPLDTPCALCRHRPATVEERDPDGEGSRRICFRCSSDRRLGAELPRARWLVIRDRPRRATRDLDVLGLGVSIESSAQPSLDPGVISVSNLASPETPPEGKAPFSVRRLARHIPTNADGLPIEFTAIAASGKGLPLLAVLKMDVDSLGLSFQRALTEGGLEGMRSLSNELEAFFADRFNREMSRPEFRMLYTVFAGGDDSLLVGPWNVVLAFAGHIRRLFGEAFASRGLTLSAGIALTKPKRPLRTAAEHAEGLLAEAKSIEGRPGQGPKNQCAALGQMWKWEDHRVVLENGEQLVSWTNERIVQRGWLHTVLELSLARARGDLAATARLAYHVGRNWPKRGDPRGSKARAFADQLIQDFDAQTSSVTRYLPAITRYALTATRRNDEED
ncbi:MAG: type III-A CRISPR-associated protein Cas10/Csm1 [Myxococcales bacterium]|jgi:CRISPR-associated protein Csm1